MTGKILGLSAAFALAIASLNADLKLKVKEAPPPEALSPEIRSQLGDIAVQLTDGEKAVYELWFAKTLPVKHPPASAGDHLKTLKQMTLLGAVALGRDGRDYRDDELVEGVYTLRFGLKPEDGNHLGTSEFPYFAVLVPASLDKKPDAFSSPKKMVNASSSETASEHPMIMSLRPAASTGGLLPQLIEPADEHKSIRVRVPAQTEGGDETELVFEIVYEGMGEF